MDFLFEIGLEEIPARMIPAAQAELLKRTIALLERERLLATGAAAATSYSTPRRLAVVVPGVLERQPDLTEEVLGPAVKIAYKDGAPTPAAIAFARKSGVDVKELRTVETPRGEYLAATSIRHGRLAEHVIVTELPKELAEIYWAKAMYWRAGKPERFVRPVRWLCALLGGEVVPVEFGGYTAGRETYGHRILFGAGPIEIGEPAEYAESLRNGFVMAAVEQRRHTIRKALDRVCRIAAGTRWREDHALVDKMTHMTEWPSVILGNFDRGYLTLPEEVLVTVMRDHQNYFAVEDEQGKLAPHFLAVLNTVADAAGEAVIRHGNERVLRARFNDARFFWEFDQRLRLRDRVALLEKVTFQKDLGSYAAKSERVRKLAAALVANLSGADAAALDEAARLAKTDLTTELVKEFTELQGRIGGLYARTQGLDEKVADAIYDQYLPVSMEDSIPRTVEGQLLAVTDKADTIAGMFSLGMEPTGSRDPFALRRAANGIVKILAESKLALTLGQIALASAPAAASASHEELVRKLEVFFAERVEFYLREARGQAYDVVAAVLAAGANDVRDAVARAAALTSVRGSDDFVAVCAAFKRMKNILAQSGHVHDPVAHVTADGVAPAQQELADQAQSVAIEVERRRAAGDYESALREVATLRPQVDAFFDQLMVMDPDPDVRASRLTLLAHILHQFSQIADFSQIVVAG